MTRPRPRTYDARPMKRPPLPTARLALLRSLTAVALAAAPDTSRGAAIELTPCRLEGLGTEARCGTFRVFEDRDQAAGRQIDLRVAVIDKAWFYAEARE